MTYTAYLGLGSNLGDRLALMNQGLSCVLGPETIVDDVSSLYASDPVGPVRDQPVFYNAVARIRTSYTPRTLLQRCLAVEARLGRKRTIDKGPRTIDLDLLLVDDLVAHWPELIVPHPELTRRAFVLTPLLEIAPAIKDPRDGTPLRQYLDPLRASQPLIRIMKSWRTVTRMNHQGSSLTPGSCPVGR